MRRPFIWIALLAIALVPGGATAGTSAAPEPLTLAVIGDTPYGPEQLAAFPALVADINDDRRVSLALHLGDIKTGSSPCTDDYFAQIRTLFDTFEDPLVFTPGDNEWTDCHRAAAGGYLPTERLAELRETFYPQPGLTLGQNPRAVENQADVPGFEPFVENQLWQEAGVVFSAVHVVGSNNDLEPWFGAAETPEQRTLRLAEYASRLAADLAWLDETFELAAQENARGVVIAMQADMWDAFAIENGLPLDGFDPVVERLAELAQGFRRHVLVLQGDSHQFLVDRPLLHGSPVHGVETAAPNVLRVVVEGATASEWLRLRIGRQSTGLFSFERVKL